MIDKYKRPRVQRLFVPKSREATIAAHQRLTDAAKEWASSLARTIIGTQIATQAARVSGAMPGDLSPWELRSDWQ